jgi:hypothetical protein
MSDLNIDCPTAGCGKDAEWESTATKLIGTVRFVNQHGSGDEDIPVFDETTDISPWECQECGLWADGELEYNIEQKYQES